jgi:hypothetical protein
MSPGFLRCTTFAFFFAVAFGRGPAARAQDSDCPGPQSQNESQLQNEPQSKGEPPSQNYSEMRATRQAAPIGEADFGDVQNRWQLEPADLRLQVDTVNPTLREERDAFWKIPLGEYRDMAKGGGVALSSGVLVYPQEFPAVEGATWVIATFETFRVFAVAGDDELIYTEMNFRVENVLKLPEGLSLSSGALVDTGFPGGRIKTANGQIISSREGPMQHFFQPGHKYLVQLLYERKGEFFLANERWDLSSGRVEPSPVFESEGLPNNGSSIAGMTVPELINCLPAVLPDEPANALAHFSTARAGGPAVYVLSRPE